MSLWMQTFSGRKVFPAHLRPEDIVLIDVAHALSRICRFGGHAPKHWSVAQHAVLVSYVVADLGGSLEEQFHGLHHDDSEAYLGDVVWPLKNDPSMAGYRDIERIAEAALAVKWGLASPEMPDIVKQADMILLATEKRDIMGGSIPGEPWHCDDITPMQETIVPLEARGARDQYVSRHIRLCSQLGLAL